MMLSCIGASAAQATDLRVDAVLTGTGIPSGMESSRKGGTLVETVYVSGDSNRVRVDFRLSSRLRGRIYRDGDHSVLRLPSGRTLPANWLHLGARVRFPLHAPCFHLGFVCHKQGEREIAGRRVLGWRYREAGRQGPQGTDQGTFWLDAKTGVVLAFEGRDVAGLTYVMHAVAVRDSTLPAQWFELPKPAGRNASGADGASRQP
ncbi:hypothetical protein BTJ49_04070 [Oleiagrimonas sp. MCCC 1A03011]|nr:hypothetical protein BTJ49_04070 [Oleiagrimonas sp. MCCC 1A03011]